jgi:hypothetical protein
MKELLNSTLQTKKITFMGKKDAVEIRKLTGRQVKNFQKEVKSLKDLPEEDQLTLVQNKVIRLGVVGAEDLSDEELDEFPLDEIANLAKQVFAYSGIDIDAGQDKKGNG